jgi:glycosyltransferase involved in cell wall biosynthesis
VGFYCKKLKQYKRFLFYGNSYSLKGNTLYCAFEASVHRNREGILSKKTCKKIPNCKRNIVAVVTPKFSVLMPVYFKENPHFLDAALESILTQTLLPSEVLIIEDGKLTTQLYEVIERHVRKHPDLFRVISIETNRGMGYAMDLGVKNCNYEYIARMDTDDLSHPERFEIQLSSQAENQDVDVVGSYIEEFNTTPGDLKRFRKVPTEHYRIVQYAKIRCPLNHMTVVFKKSRVIEAGSYWDKKALEDYHLWYQMIKAGGRFHNIPKILVYARVGNNMERRRKGKEYFEHELLFFKSMHSDGFINLIQLYSGLAARFLIRVLPVPVLRLVYDKLLRQHHQ